MPYKTHFCLPLLVNGEGKKATSDSSAQLALLSDQQDTRDTQDSGRAGGTARAERESDLKDFRVKRCLSTFGMRLTGGSMVYSLKQQTIRFPHQMNDPIILTDI